MGPNSCAGDYVVVSAKNDAILSRLKTNNMCYRLQFRLSRDDGGAINPKEHISFDTYVDILRLNADVLDDVSLEEVPDEPNSRFVLMQIKPVGASMGVKGKYIITKANLILPEGKACAGLVGASVPLSQPKTLVPKAGYEELKCENMNLFAFWDSTAACMVVQYDFTLCDPTFKKHGLAVPRAVSDMSALLIKKLFLRVKEYKERQVNTPNCVRNA